MLLTWLLSPSGGLEYHLRALRRRHRDWAGFRGEVADWLDGWRPASPSLLLIGPSAGWCLPDGFLARFARIDVVDLDPLAPLLFRAVHGRALAAAGTRLRFTRADALDDLDALLGAHPDHAVLFANVLGQRYLHCDDDEDVDAELAALPARLAGRAWASFHDRLSGSPRDVAGAPRGFACDEALTPEALARRLGASGEWVDHCTTHVLPEGVARRIMPWPLRPGLLHWIEAGSVG